MNENTTTHSSDRPLVQGTSINNLGKKIAPNTRSGGEMDWGKWIEDNKTSLFAAFIVLIVVLVVGGLYINSNNKSKEEFNSKIYQFEQKSFSNKSEVKPIKSFLKRIKNPIDIEDDVIYKRVTIKTNHNGISLRDEEIGANIGTKKQFTVKPNQFLLSKIDARNGAFGIVPVVLDNAIITGNFWTYDVDKSIVDINWFLYFTESHHFIDICKTASTGSTHRKYLDETKFLNHKIKVPSIDEQHAIVNQINKVKDLQNLNLQIQMENENLYTGILDSYYKDI